MRGVETCLAVEALDITLRTRLDSVILVAGSAAYVVLARRLAAAGASVMVVGFDVPGQDRRGRSRRERTATALLEEAVWPTTMSQLIDGAHPDAVLIRRLFPIRKPAATPPKAEPAEKRESGPAPPQAAEEIPPEGPLQGTIADVKERMGFLIEDWNGKRLFFHFSALGDFRLKDLSRGQRVSYERGLDPRNRPAAKNVLVLAGDHSSIDAEVPQEKPAATAEASDKPPEATKTEEKLFTPEDALGSPAAEETREDTAPGTTDEPGAETVAGAADVPLALSPGGDAQELAEGPEERVAQELPEQQEATETPEEEPAPVEPECTGQEETPEPVETTDGTQVAQDAEVPEDSVAAQESQGPVETGAAEQVDPPEQADDPQGADSSVALEAFPNPEPVKSDLPDRGPEPEILEAAEAGDTQDKSENQGEDPVS